MSIYIAASSWVVFPEQSPEPAPGSHRHSHLNSFIHSRPLLSLSSPYPEAYSIEPVKSHHRFGKWISYLRSLATLTRF